MFCAGSYFKETEMPKQVQDIKQFLEICRRKDAKCTSLPYPYLPFLAVDTTIAAFVWDMANV